MLKKLLLSCIVSFAALKTMQPKLDNFSELKQCIEQKYAINIAGVQQYIKQKYAMHSFLIEQINNNTALQAFIYGSKFSIGYKDPSIVEDRQDKKKYLEAKFLSFK